MVRNGRKRREQLNQLQQNMKPGAQIMLQSGIFGTIESLDEEDENRVVISSGTSTLVVHKNAIGTVVEPAETDDEETLAPDDDPDFGAQSDDENNKEV